MPAAENPDVQAVLRLLPTPARLPLSQERVRRVHTADELIAAINSSAPNTTVLLADGVYNLPMDKLCIAANGLCLRGESGDREKVILDGGTQWGRLVSIRGASDVLIADLAVRNCKRYGVFLYGDSNVQRPKVYNVKFHNCWVRGLKGTHPRRIQDKANQLNPPEVVEKIRPRGGEVRHCLFIDDHPKTFTDDTFDGDYIGGIDMMGLRDWTIADNAFIGIRGHNGGGRGAIFIWVGSDHVVAERNLIVNCDRGICFGNPSGDGPHMTAGIVRNNVIVGGVNMAIEMAQTVDTLVAGNSVWATHFDYARTINVDHGFAGGRCINNLVHGKVDLPSAVESRGNIVGNLEGWFINPAIGDLRLTAQGRAARVSDRPCRRRWRISAGGNAPTGRSPAPMRSGDAIAVLARILWPGQLRLARKNGHAPHDFARGNVYRAPARLYNPAPCPTCGTTCKTPLA